MTRRFSRKFSIPTQLMNLPSSRPTFSSICAILVVAAASRAMAGLVTESASYSANFAIPDNSLLGVSDTRTFISSIAAITEVRAALNIAGAPTAGDAFNGDFYAYLTHSSGFAVLLNRTGRTAANSFGYSDSGFNLTFDDSPAGTDVHSYQLTANPGGGTLTGIWGSDGRNVAPSTALVTTPRTAFLTSFNHLDPNGGWTIFVADVSSGGTSRLVSWGLEISGNTAIPEPSSSLYAILLTGILLGRRYRSV